MKHNGRAGQGNARDPMTGGQGRYVTDRRIMDGLTAVFGAGNVLAASHPAALENSFTVRTDRPEIARKIVELLTRALPDVFVFESVGGFVATQTPRVGIALGTEDQRERNPELNSQAASVLTFLEGHPQFLKAVLVDANAYDPPRRF